MLVSFDHLWAAQPVYTRFYLIVLFRFVIFPPQKRPLFSFYTVDCRCRVRASPVSRRARGCQKTRRELSKGSSRDNTTCDVKPIAQLTKTFKERWMCTNSIYPARELRCLRSELNSWRIANTVKPYERNSNFNLS